MSQSTAIEKNPTWYQSEVLLCLLIGAFTSVVFALFGREPLGSDDCSYFAYAAGYNPPYYQTNGQRLGFVGVIWLFQQIMGYSWEAYWLTAYFYFVGLIISSFLLVRLLFGTLAGLLTVLWLCSDPNLLEIAPLLLPETGGIFWFITGLFLYTYAFKHQDYSKYSPYILVASAISFYASVLTKETFSLMVPGVFSILLLNNHENIRSFLNKNIPFITTIFSIFVIERIAYWKVFGDPLYRINTMLGHHVKGVKTLWVEKGIVPDDLTFYDLATRFITGFYGSFEDITFLSLRYYQIIFSLIIVLALIALKKQSKKLLFLGVFLILAWASVSLPVAKLEPIVPLLRTKPRYFLPCNVFLSIFLSAAFCEIFVNNFCEKFPYWIASNCKVVFGGMMVFVPSFFIYKWYNSFTFITANGAGLMQTVQQIIPEIRNKDLPVNRVVGDFGLIRTIAFFAPNEKPYYKRWIEDGNVIEPGDLIIHPELNFHAPDKKIYWSHMATTSSTRRGIHGIYYGLDPKKVQISTRVNPSFIHKANQKFLTEENLILQLDRDSLPAGEKSLQFAITLRLRDPRNEIGNVKIITRYSDPNRPIKEEDAVYWKGDTRAVVRWISAIIDRDNFKSMEIVISVPLKSKVQFINSNVWLVEPTIDMCSTCNTLRVLPS